jgi:hypothetical protein
MEIDPQAYTASLPPCFITPIAARSIGGIQKYLGRVEYINPTLTDAFIVHFQKYQQPNNFDIWNHPRASLINGEKQLWVDVNYTDYRKVYSEVFPEVLLTKDIAIDHLMNRKLTSAFEYKYIRVLHIDKSINTKHGTTYETLAIRGDKHDKVSKELKIASHIEKESEAQKNQQIQYADTFELAKILNLPCGSKGFFWDISCLNNLFYYGETILDYYKCRLINAYKDLFDEITEKPSSNKSLQRRIDKAKILIPELNKEINRLELVKRKAMKK